MITRIRMGLAALLILLFHIAPAAAKTRFFQYTQPDGTQVFLDDDRKPALYTGKFGNCLGSNAINLDRFDAAYYKDNMTVLFHFGGTTELRNEVVMMYIGVYAYGSDRFDLVFNPCSANIYSMCPLNSSVPITASGIIPVAPSDVANIPDIALSIPDFEGEAILRIFSNATHEEIGCYTAIVTNGGSFSQPAAVGSVLGVLTFIAMIASFATAIYGEAVPTMRLHYAHSLSVGVVFAVWHHIFFTGALSVNWPSVLPAWQSNFAWAAGMIYSSSMQNSINGLVGNNAGNTTETGAAQAGADNSNVGGGFDISLIYNRDLQSGVRRAAKLPYLRNVASQIYNRDYSKVLSRYHAQRAFKRAMQAGGNTIPTDYRWFGREVGPGLPLPGNFSGFAGTLAAENIRTSNAFMTGFLWFLILLVLIVAAVLAFKWILESLARIKWVKEDRLQFFRDRWLGYTAVVALRTCYIAFFAMMFLTMFQFTFQSSGGAKAVAAIVFIIFIVGIPSIVAYAYWYKLNVTDHANELGERPEHNRLLGGMLPIPRFGRKKTTEATVQESGVKHERSESKSSDMEGNEDSLRSIHDDEDYTMKFGWLASRFRRTRWWFFTVWIFYEFLRAVFYGAAATSALAQVFGVLVIEVLAFGFIVWARPFEGQRLNIIVVYCLGLSKVATVGLSAAFYVGFNLERITTTAIGIVIIVIQGFLTIITMIAIIVGAISSYMSISRNREDFRPRKWHGMREKYFNHLDKAVNDLPRPPKAKPEPPPPPEEPKFGFAMTNVRRMAKIEDEDAEFTSEMRNDPNASQMSLHDNISSPVLSRSGNATPVGGHSRAPSRAASTYSMSQTSLPFGARKYRSSWSAKDFSGFDLYDGEHIDPDDSVPPVPPVPLVHSRSVTMPIKLQAQRSVESLSVGGDVSTRDSIGSVPAPAMRPRSGTHASVRSAVRSISSIHGLLPEASKSAEQLDMDLPEPRPLGKRATYSGYGSKSQPLTPAQETEEWTITKELFDAHKK